MERDFWLSLDLLKSPKDHVEFTLVRDWIRDALAGVASKVTVEVPKSVLKQVRHVCGVSAQADESYKGCVHWWSHAAHLQGVLCVGEEGDRAVPQSDFI